MKIQGRPRIYLLVACAIFALHLVVATTVKPSYAMTMFSDAIPCALLIVAIDAGFRVSPHTTRLLHPIFLLTAHVVA